MELLTVVAVTAVLAGIALATGHWGIRRAAMAREVNAARTLATAYASAASDEDGKLLPGYDDGAQGYDLPGGESISPAAAHRYPFRLAPYFGFTMDGTILVNRNKAQIARMSGSSAYFRSLFPALGMNTTYVGGRFERGNVDSPNECVTRLAQVGKPSMTLLFASAGYGAGDEKVDGFHELDPPNKHVTLWTGSDEGSRKSPDNYGHVDFRYDGQAVCAFLDGSVRLMGPGELRDMRYWSRNAQEANNPSYTMALAGPPPGRGGR